MRLRVTGFPQRFPRKSRVRVGLKTARGIRCLVSCTLCLHSHVLTAVHRYHRLPIHAPRGSREASGIHITLPATGVLFAPSRIRHCIEECPPRPHPTSYNNPIGTMGPHLSFTISPVTSMAVGGSQLYPLASKLYQTPQIRHIMNLLTLLIHPLTSDSTIQAGKV